MTVHRSIAIEVFRIRVVRMSLILLPGFQCNEGAVTTHGRLSLAARTRAPSELPACDGLSETNTPVEGRVASGGIAGMDARFAPATVFFEGIAPLTQLLRRRRRLRGGRCARARSAQPGPTAIRRRAPVRSTSEFRAEIVAS